MQKLLAVCFTLMMAALVSSQAAAGKLPKDASQVCPIKVGQSLPSVTVADIDGKSVKLNDIVAQKPTVLVFYRGSWCPYCNTHLGELKTVEADLKKLGYQIVALSPDLPENLKKSVEKNTLEYTLLSDSKVSAAKALGLAFEVDEETYAKYLGYGINLEQASGEKHHALPIPAAIIIDTDGVVKFTFTSPDYTVRVNSKLLLSAAQASL